MVPGGYYYGNQSPVGLGYTKQYPSQASTMAKAALYHLTTGFEIKYLIELEIKFT